MDGKGCKRMPLGHVSPSRLNTDCKRQNLNNTPYNASRSKQNPLSTLRCSENTNPNSNHCIERPLSCSRWDPKTISEHRENNDSSSRQGRSTAQIHKHHATTHNHTSRTASSISSIRSPLFAASFINDPTLINNPRLSTPSSTRQPFNLPSSIICGDRGQYTSHGNQVSASTIGSSTPSNTQQMFSLPTSIIRNGNGRFTPQGVPDSASTIEQVNKEILKIQRVVTSVGQMQLSDAAEDPY